MASLPDSVDIRLLHAGKLAVQVTSPAPRAVWRKLLDQDPEALLFQEPQWIDAMTATGQYVDASRLFEFENGGQFVLPLVRRTGLPGGMAVEASFPEGWGTGGLIGPRPVTSQEVTAVFDDFARRRVLQATIRPNPLFDAAWSAGRLEGVLVKHKRAHVLDLRGGFEQVSTELFAGSMRSAVRKAERSGLEVECDTTGRLLPDFYRLFLSSVDRWAAQQHEPRWLAHFRARQRDPLKKFQAIAAALGDAFRLWVAKKDGRPVAAILVVMGKNASYTRGAMDIELGRSLRANELLHRMAIEDACLAGCRRYHMGETGSSKSLAQFKEKLGAVPVEYSQYTYERLPITQVDLSLRRFVKGMIGFKDAE